MKINWKKKKRDCHPAFKLNFGGSGVCVSGHGYRIIDVKIKEGGNPTSPAKNIIEKNYDAF